MIIKGDSIRKKFNILSKIGIFDDILELLLNEYIDKYDIDHLFIDSYDCINVSGVNDNIGYGHKYKCKKVSKITLLVDKNRIPICVDICKGNIHDNTRIINVIQGLPKIINKTYNKPLLIGADKGYIINKFKNKNLRTIHHVSIITDKKKNMKKRVTKQHKDFLKGRIIIEHLNSVLRKKFKHLSRITDKNEKCIKRWFAISFIYLIVNFNNKNIA